MRAGFLGGNRPARHYWLKSLGGQIWCKHKRIARVRPDFGAPLGALRQEPVLQAAHDRRRESERLRPDQRDQRLPEVAACNRADVSG